MTKLDSQVLYAVIVWLVCKCRARIIEKRYDELREVVEM